MHYTKKIIHSILAGICILAGTAHALPIEQIRKQGEYLKSLITQANFEQFKKDSVVFFEFDPQFPLSGQQMFEYKKVAKELLNHANMTRAEKFEERKLLLGKTIHNWRAFSKAVLLGATTGVGFIGSSIALFMGINPGYPMDVPNIIIGVAGFGVTALCAWGTRYYKRQAVNGIDAINQQMRDLWSIIEITKQINAQMNGAEETRA